MEHEMLTIEREIAENKKQIGALQERVKTLFTRTESQQKLLDTMNSLAMSVQKPALGQDQLTKDVGGLKKDVDQIKDRPRKRWEGVVDKFLYTAIGALAAYLLGKVGIV